MEDNWLKWSKRLKAMSQIGLTYTKNPYDIERYIQIGEIAVEMLSTSSGIKENEIKELFIHDSGYATPKVDLRAAAFKEDKIFFICKIVGGSHKESIEISEIDFFPRDNTPELSIARVLPEQIDLMFDHYYNMSLLTTYD